MILQKVQKQWTTVYRRKMGENNGTLGRIQTNGNTLHVKMRETMHDGYNYKVSLVR